MRENLNYYLALPSVVKEDVVDLEAKVQKKLYRNMYKKVFTKQIDLKH